MYDTGSHRLIRIVALLFVCATWAAASSPAVAQESAKLPVTGEADSRLAPFDELLTAFVTKRNIPGAALAVTKNGRLVYARGFGYADVENKQPVQPDSLFRIASI